MSEDRSDKSFKHSPVGYHMEPLFDIWGTDASHLEIGPDRDGRGFIEIRKYHPGTSNGNTMVSFEVEQAAYVALALMELVQRKRSQAQMREGQIQQAEQAEQAARQAAQQGQP